MSLQTEARCAKCGERHRHTDEHGWYAVDERGKPHPFTPGPIEETSVVVGRIVDGNEQLAGWVTLEACGVCKALVEPKHAGWHHDWHERLEEALGIAWQLLNDREGAA